MLAQEHAERCIFSYDERMNDLPREYQPMGQNNAYDKGSETDYEHVIIKHWASESSNFDARTGNCPSGRCSAYQQVGLFMHVEEPVCSSDLLGKNTGILILSGQECRFIEV